MIEIRELKADETDLLRDFLYEAIFVPEGMTPPDRSIVERPELALYYLTLLETAGILRSACCLL